MSWVLEHWAGIQAFAVQVGVSILSALAALGATFRIFGDRLFGHLLDQRLQREKQAHDVKLEQIKHEQNRQIEALRATIDHLTDRGRHSNEREYSALSAIWAKFVDLYYATNTCLVSMVEHPDFSRMSDAELTEFLDTTEFSREQKAAVEKARDKNRSFSNIIERRYINKARLEHYELSLLLHQQGIFIPKHLKAQFSVGAKMCAAVIAQRYTEQGSAPTGLKHDLEFTLKGEAMLEALKDLTRARLLRE